MELTANRSVTVLIAALGGEGGGVLADWLIDAAGIHDFPVQSTSVPGVAQRTGATTYYLEIFPVPGAQLQGREPVMSLTPMPGEIDVVAASELIEAGRVMQNGFVDPQRTTLVASTHREYAVVEKAAMSDGRFDVEKVVKTAQGMARRLVMSDLKAIALREGTVINTVMFGAMAGSGALPLSREACEEAIRRSGKAVDASLRGFAAGFALGAAQLEAPAVAKAAPQPRTETPVQHPRVAALPAPIREIVQAGVEQVVDYQDAAYGELYLDHVESIHALERGTSGAAPEFSVTRETARYLALWMSYEDVVRVADLKSRKERLDRVRSEVGAKPGEPLILTEYLKPGVEELCSMLPPGLADRVRRRAARSRRNLNVGMHLKTNTVPGFLMLVALRSLRPLRRRSSRYIEEHRLIGEWLAAIRTALPVSTALALELALCGNLVKGYGETSERGHGNLKKILFDMADHMPPTADEAEQVTARVRDARRAALSDPEGQALAGVLGLPAPELKARPIRFIRKEKIAAG